MELLGWIIAAGTALGLLVRFVGRPMWRLLRGLYDFLRTWNGEPDRPGVPGYPGVPERLARIEHHVGNGSDRPLREVVTCLERTTEAQARAIGALVQAVGIDGGYGDDLKP